MIVNGKVIDPKKLGHAFTYTSKALTDKFYHLDRIMFSMSPFLTDDEAWLILTEAEKRATSRLEGNWTAGDSIQFCKDLLGEARWQALEMAWEINSQNAVTQLFAPNELRDCWVHKLSMTEVPAEVALATPEDYILIQTTKEKGRQIIV
jgi:hypothetical protein